MAYDKISFTNTNGSVDNYVNEKNVTAQRAQGVLASIPFNNSGQIWLSEFEFNGQKFQPVMLDTGNFETMFPQSFATQLKLPNLGTIQVGSSGGQTTGYKTMFNMTLGTKTYSNQNGYVLPDSATQAIIVLGWANLVSNKISFKVDFDKWMIDFYG